MSFSTPILWFWPLLGVLQSNLHFEMLYVTEVLCNLVLRSKEQLNLPCCENIISLYLYTTELFVDIWFYVPVFTFVAVLQGKISRAVGLMGVLKFAD